jgi:hypothetical protein
MVEEDMLAEACYENKNATSTDGTAKHHAASIELSSSIEKKISTENQPRRATKKHLLPFLAHGLYASRSVDPNRRLCPARSHRRHRRCAGARPGRLGLSHSALKKTNSHIMSFINHNQLNVHTMFELRTTLNLSRVGLPVRKKLIHEHNVMRIAHGNWDSTHLARFEIHRSFYSDGGLAHLDLKFVLPLGLSRQ